MSSLDLLKQELITQKTKLDTKGYSVNCSNHNPSPGEITTTIDKLPDLNQVTSTPSDVLNGKTFISSTGELQLGSYDPGNAELIERANRYYAIVFGVGDRYEVEIPTDSKYSRILEYAFCGVGATLAYKHDLTIPPNITSIEEYAFYRCAGLTGTLTVPNTCTFVGQRAFYYCENINHIVFGAPITKDSNYLFDHCASVESITLTGEVTAIPGYFCSYCTLLKNLTIPAEVTTIYNYAMRNSPAIEYLIFLPTNPPNLYSNGFSYANASDKYYPYNSYSKYMTATNYPAVSGNKYAHGTFNTGEILPTSTTGYNLTWFASREDLKNSTNPITVAPNNEMLFARATAQ